MYVYEKGMTDWCPGEETQDEVTKCTRTGNFWTEFSVVYLPSSYHHWHCVCGSVPDVSGAQRDPLFNFLQFVQSAIIIRVASPLGRFLSSGQYSLGRSHASMKLVTTRGSGKKDLISNTVMSNGVFKPPMKL